MSPPGDQPVFTGPITRAANATLAAWSTVTPYGLTDADHIDSVYGSRARTEITHIRGE